jgi:hypothetical protein
MQEIQTPGLDTAPLRIECLTPLTSRTDGGAERG